MGNKIFFEADAQSILNSLNDSYSKIFLLVDENTHQHCWPVLSGFLQSPNEVEIIEIPCGEEYKTLSVCEQIWWSLAENGADRQSLILNLGGGVVTDLGAFIASCYMRGIEYYNIPTSLLAMADAAVGGKNGVDLGVLKNLVGTIDKECKTLIFSDMLDSLPNDEFMSGMAECLKHGLIYNKPLWQNLIELNFEENESVKPLLAEIINVKKEVVDQDPTEKTIRKILNYGHTYGHAIESTFLEEGKKVKHGVAIVIGMILENLQAVELGVLSSEISNEVNDLLRKHYNLPDYKSLPLNKVVEKLKYDKKNASGKLRFSLISEIGKCEYNVELEIEKAEEFLKKHW